MEPFLLNSFFAEKSSKSLLVERRLVVHLDQINYILSLPNNERYTSYLLDYEETYTSFTVDPEDWSKLGNQATTSGKLREYQKLQKSKGKAKEVSSLAKASTIVVEGKFCRDSS